MGEDAALRTALCTCPIEAAAKGMRSNDSKHSDHDVPNASRRTSYYTELKKKGKACDFYNSLPSANQACDERCLVLF